MIEMATLACSALNLFQKAFSKLCRRGTEDANADKTGPRQSAAAAQRQATWSSISRMRAERSCKDTGFWISSTSRSTRP